jgi:hypothetical protein
VEPGENPAVSICPISRAYYADYIHDCSESEYMAVYNDTLKIILDAKHEL